MQQSFGYNSEYLIYQEYVVSVPFGSAIHECNKQWPDWLVISIDQNLESRNKRVGNWKAKANCRSPFFQLYKYRKYKIYFVTSYTNFYRFRLFIERRTLLHKLMLGWSVKTIFADWNRRIWVGSLFPLKKICMLHWLKWRLKNQTLALCFTLGKIFIAKLNWKNQVRFKCYRI